MDDPLGLEDEQVYSLVQSTHMRIRKWAGFSQLIINNSC